MLAKTRLTVCCKCGGSVHSAAYDSCLALAETLFGADVFIKRDSDYNVSMILCVLPDC